MAGLASGGAGPTLFLGLQNNPAKSSAASENPTLDACDDMFGAACPITSAGRLTLDGVIQRVIRGSWWDCRSEVTPVVTQRVMSRATIGNIFRNQLGDLADLQPL